MMNIDHLHSFVVQLIEKICKCVDGKEERQLLGTQVTSSRKRNLVKVWYVTFFMNQGSSK